MRRTKMVCTLGPAASGPEMIRRLVAAGMDVARLNFSHGAHDTHGANYAAVRAAAAEAGRNVAILADLQGPKIRTGRLAGGQPVALVKGETFCITTREVEGNERCVSTSYQSLPRDVRMGDRILLADGTMALEVACVEPPDVYCTVVRGGMLGERKGINLPGVDVSAPCLTEKDLADLTFAMALGVDYVALSFVRKASDVLALRAAIEARDGARPHIVAKIERPEAVACFGEIVRVTDAVMVARGDLGIEAELEDIPQLQKALIRECNAAGVPVITATQMLESMVEHAQPTRAEVSDVANAIYDGTDAVMLSGETAAGQFPIEAAAMMAEIAAKADEALALGPLAERRPYPAAAAFSYADAIGQAACRMSAELPAARILCFTQSGFTARFVARYRPKAPITAITISDETRRRCALYWGVETVLAAEIEGLDQMIRSADALIRQHALASPGQTVLVIAGVPFAVGGTTNLLHLHRVG